MSNISVKMEYDLAALSIFTGKVGQHLKTVYHASLQKNSAADILEIIEEIMEELSIVYEKSQQNGKCKKRRKKNKKEIEEQRGACQELARILDSMI